MMASITIVLVKQEHKIETCFERYQETAENSKFMTKVSPDAFVRK